MIFGKLQNYEKLGLGSLGESVTKAVSWIRSLPSIPSEGRYELDEGGMYAVIMRYATVDTVEARYESHRKFVDLQYTIDGSEGIDVRSASELEFAGDYDPDTDLQFYLPGDAVARIEMLPEHFSIHFPEDAHRPKLKSGDAKEVFKLVVKIPTNRFAV